MILSKQFGFLGANSFSARGIQYKDVTASGNWTVYDVSVVDAGVIGLAAGVFDGRYIYLIPYYSGSFHGHVARYDTQATFDSSGSWDVYDVTAVDSNAKGFYGGVFDGRYLYLVPHNNGGYHGHVAQFDTKKVKRVPNSISGGSFF